MLPAAQLPITVKLVDAQGAAVGDGQWTGTVAFAEGQTAADVALPAVEGYVTPALTVERNKDTTALNVTAIYAAAKPAEKASFTATFAIAGSENGKVTAAGAEATNGYSLKLTEGKPEYSFYDGPPFATGLPHYGHILAGTIKDIVTRYATQTGHHVTRRFGWDCHGLPVEYEIDQKLNITCSQDVDKIGIATYASRRAAHP